MIKINIKVDGITVMCGENLWDIFSAIENADMPDMICIKNDKELKSVVDNDDISRILIVNPENCLHPKWQTYCADMIVVVAKKYNKKILLTTNSFHFLESLVFFIEKYGYTQPVEYCLIHNKESFDISDSPYDVMKSLSEPSFDLADMKLEFEMEGNNERND